MTKVLQGMIVAISVLFLAVAAADARKYKGARVDIYSGDVVGRWIIRTHPLPGGVLKTKVKCRPARGEPVTQCGPFASKLEFQLIPDAGSEFSYTGEFDLDGVPCTCDATVYQLGFDGVYTCGATQGSITGSRKVHRPYGHY